MRIFLRPVAATLLVVLVAFGVLPGATASNTASLYWKYALPAGSGIVTVRSASDVVVAAGSSTFALERSSGRLRWQANDHASAIVIGVGLLFFGTDRGGLGARSLVDGTLRWHHPNLCPDVVYRILLASDDVIVGCAGGNVVRVAARRGTIEARSGMFPVDRIADIVRLGSCAYGITGWQGGALLRERIEILDCRRLQAILPGAIDTDIVGSTGETAILDDRSPFGRGGPTLFRVNLRSGARSPEIDLDPDPSHSPPKSERLEPIGRVGLAGSALYMGTDRALYSYGDATSLSPSTPARRIADDLDAPPQFLPGRLVALRIRKANLAYEFVLAQLRGARLAPELRQMVPSGLAGLYSYDPEDTPLLLTLGATLIRLPDGRHVHIDSACRPTTTDDEFIVMMCTTKTLAGNLYFQDIAMYHWQQ